MHDTPLNHLFSAGQQDGTTILKLTGPLTLSTMFPVQEELRSIKPQVLILDLTDTPYIDSAGIGVIANSYVSAERDGRTFLLAGANSRVQTLLSLTKLDTILKNFPTVQDAEASL